MLCAWMARRPGATGTQRGQTTRVGLRSPDKGEEGEEAILGGSCRQRWQGGAGPGHVLGCWSVGRPGRRLPGAALALKIHLPAAGPGAAGVWK